VAAALCCINTTYYCHCETSSHLSDSTTTFITYYFNIKRNFKYRKNICHHCCHQSKWRLGLFGQFNSSSTTVGMGSGAVTREGYKGKDRSIRAFATLSIIMKLRWMRLQQSLWGMFRCNWKIILLLQAINFQVQLVIHISGSSGPKCIDFRSWLWVQLVNATH